MDPLLSVRLIGYLALLYVLVVAFFALVEISLPKLCLIAGIGLLILIGLGMLRRRQVKQVHRHDEPAR